MSRRYADAVRVDLDPGRVGDATEGDEITVPTGADTPAQFLWRGRLYVVRGVLAHWVEVGPWWRTAALVGTDPGPDPRAVPVAGAATTGAAPGVHAGAGGTDEPGEREVWRVEAAAGRAAPTGVFDLSHDPGSGRWTLARALD